ncbi:methylated-DNA-protein-cysteine methyltransferase [Geoanaerobacter pelophilus]|uniref:Methylated-DNA-protein-cysteine methyltransferase n=1 Tax=Geoanaerobacter pelophilus TaxID=60036 RepID=A0ABQ0MK16_9BACT|nr:methylated-DNA--[protein]-cysteine S-methyltransferase [Geoanaerobacter pelophilus]GAW67389.1 methylated-DNA-protein-cysteine methyltransferase [Geoanaerobacter pelophilus]
MKKNHAAATARSIYQAPCGFGVLAANDNGLVAHHLPFGCACAGDALELAAELHPEAVQESALTRAAAELMARYFAGEPVSFDLPLELQGFTPFQVAVYRFVAGIPYGKVASYQEVAAACGSPRGARAVGGAMASNALPILIPCHRVVGASGVMTGFTAPGGVASKRELLVMEGVVLSGSGVFKGRCGGVLHRISTGAQG